MSKKQQQDSGFTVEHDGTLYNLREGLIGLKALSPDPTPLRGNDVGTVHINARLSSVELDHQVVGGPICEGNACKIGGESDQAEDRDTPIKEPVNVDEAAAFSIINRAEKALETLGFSTRISIFKSSKTCRFILSAYPRHKA